MDLLHCRVFFDRGGGDGLYVNVSPSSETLSYHDNTDFFNF